MLLLAHTLALNDRQCHCGRGGHVIFEVRLRPLFSTTPVQAKIQALLADKGKQSAPEFYEPPSCPFYQMPSGSLSP